VVKRETDFDVKLFRASITDYTRERVVCIEWGWTMLVLDLVNCDFS
jgi:hypothetical protein